MKRRVSQILSTFEEIVSMKPRKEPTLKGQHEIARLGFANKHCIWTRHGKSDIF
jgi:hypothetical protein